MDRQELDPYSYTDGLSPLLKNGISLTQILYLIELLSPKEKEELQTWQSEGIHDWQETARKLIELASDESATAARTELLVIELQLIDFQNTQFQRLMAKGVQPTNNHIKELILISEGNMTNREKLKRLTQLVAELSELDKNNEQ